MQLPPKKPQRYRHRKRREPVGSGESIAAALERLGMTDHAQRLRIQIAWREAVGPEIAERTLPASFSRGTLVVRTKNAAWANELTFLKAELIDRLNAALGKMAVRDIKVQAGHLPPPRDTSRPAWMRAPLAPDDAAAVASTAADIPDPEVRRAFEEAMGLYRRVERAAATRGPSTSSRTSGEKP